MKNKLAAVCLEAAREVAEGEEEHSCIALRKADGEPSLFRSPICGLYIDTFGNPHGNRDMMSASWYLGDLIECEDAEKMTGQRTPAEQRKLRVLALCFFAAMVEAGDL